MVNLFDIARQSGSGMGLDILSRQFGLAPAQTIRAVEAVLPAFTLAFQRAALDPAAFGELMRTIGSGRYAPFYDAPNAAQAAANGGAILDQLFKSPEASGQIAAQAAALAGVGTQALQEMMPALAATIAGGAFRVATVEGFADHLRQWGDALKSASVRINPPRPQDPWSAWQDAVSSMMGVRPEPAPAAPPASAEPATVLDAWVAMVGSMMGAAAPEAGTTGSSSSSEPDAVAQSGESPAQADSDPGSDAPEAESKAGEPNPFAALSEIFESGRTIQDQHLAAFQSILDGVWGQSRPT
ncbi:DUF937 domain-containing protein [Enterovirga rhinocerotis]|uniref:DUF937 domain-containing protein n=1 Tax=Enterovirga rhinocerotis TaxID=1339210 RepID=A0A4R7C676_9HYPH|nr:DUF937 domain-containing protein [Enterovirga rhinocerotis]TDR93898.1 hypothetical protein EV668_1167 [Enterovirga rhinocerotis]